MPWTPEFRSDLAQNLMQPFPLPNDGSDKISLRLAHWLRRYSSLKMFTDTQPDSQTDTQTTARLVYYKLTLAGELKMKTPEVLRCAYTASPWPSFFHIFQRSFAFFNICLRTQLAFDQFYLIPTTRSEISKTDHDLFWTDLIYTLTKITSLLISI